MAARTFGDRELSPNQEFRRSEIVEATTRLLRTKGLGACTVRAIADEAGISKGAVNYYFKDASELVDLGFLRLAHGYYDHIREQASRAADPVDALWRTVMLYVTPWGMHSGMGLLWMEYYVQSIRNKRLDGVVASSQAMEELFGEALAKVSEPARAYAGSLTRHVAGAILSEPQASVDPSELIAELSRLVEIAPPATIWIGCDEADCPYHTGAAQQWGALT
ncbi:MAG: TetR/AcrR family transcriptional regulator [Pseudonocardia sp.]|jgi:AcrR family transcriptional regulator